MLFSRRFAALGTRNSIRSCSHNAANEEALSFNATDAVNMVGYNYIWISHDWLLTIISSVEYLQAYI